MIDYLEYLLKTNPPTGDNLAVAYNNLMWGYSQIDIEKTRYYVGKAIDFAEKAVYKMLMSSAYRLIGDTYYNVSQYDSAMVYYEKALGAIEQAKINYLKADSIAPMTGDSLMIAIANGRLGKAFFYLNDYEQALQKAENARDYFLAK
jgi:tetratricopeptide (TPR) repeat protein